MNPHQETYIVRYLEGPWDQGGLEWQLNGLAAPGYELVTAVPWRVRLFSASSGPKGGQGAAKKK